MPDPALTERFATALARLNPDGAPIGLAVSGGPDSLALLLLAQATIPGRFQVATVDHGLRAAAADECALVARICAERRVPCAVLPVTVSEGNVQAMAREARYAALAQWAAQAGLAAVATGHHADDQAETLLLRLNRGCGLAGLAGVRDSVEIGGLRVIRPLLDVRRAELAAVCAAAGATPVADPSNDDPQYDRARLRQALANGAGADWLDPHAVARTARNLADAYAAVQDYAALLWDSQVRAEGAGFVLAPVSSREMNRRLVAAIMEQLGGRPRGGDVAGLLGKLERGERGNVAGVLGQVRGAVWVFGPEPARRGGAA